MFAYDPFLHTVTFNDTKTLRFFLLHWYLTTEWVHFLWPVSSYCTCTFYVFVTTTFKHNPNLLRTFFRQLVSQYFHIGFAKVSSSYMFRWLCSWIKMTVSEKNPNCSVTIKWFSTFSCADGGGEMVGGCQWFDVCNWCLKLSSCCQFLNKSTSYLQLMWMKQKLNIRSDISLHRQPNIWKISVPDKESLTQDTITTMHNKQTVCRILLVDIGFKLCIHKFFRHVNNSPADQSALLTSSGQ